MVTPIVNPEGRIVDVSPFVDGGSVVDDGIGIVEGGLEALATSALEVDAAGPELDTSSSKSSDLVVSENAEPNEPEIVDETTLWAATSTASASISEVLEQEASAANTTAGTVTAHMTVHKRARALVMVTFRADNGMAQTLT